MYAVSILRFCQCTWQEKRNAKGIAVYTNNGTGPFSLCFVFLNTFKLFKALFSRSLLQLRRCCPLSSHCSPHACSISSGWIWRGQIQGWLNLGFQPGWRWWCRSRMDMNEAPGLGNSPAAKVKGYNMIYRNWSCWNGIINVRIKQVVAHFKTRHLRRSWSYYYFKSKSTLTASSSQTK